MVRVRARTAPAPEWPRRPKRAEPAAPVVGASRAAGRSLVEVVGRCRVHAARIGLAPGCIVGAGGLGVAAAAHALVTNAYIVGERHQYTHTHARTRARSRRETVVRAHVGRAAGNSTRYAPTFPPRRVGIRRGARLRPEVTCEFVYGDRAPSSGGRAPISRVFRPGGSLRATALRRRRDASEFARARGTPCTHRGLTVAVRGPLRACGGQRVVARAICGYRVRETRRRAVVENRLARAQRPPRYTRIDDDDDDDNGRDGFRL